MTKDERKARKPIDGDAWYTPLEYIQSARLVMGSIDLDPASSKEAQEVVQAGSYYTHQEDGLTNKWHGNIWLNPPFSMPAIDRFVKRVVFSWQNKTISSAIVLVHNNTDTQWFHLLLANAPVCFTRGRISFWSPDVSGVGARQGQAFFYLGDKRNLFVKEFSKYGIVKL